MRFTVVGAVLIAAAVIGAVLLIRQLNKPRTDTNRFLAPLEITPVGQ